MFLPFFSIFITCCITFYFECRIDSLNDQIYALNDRISILLKRNQNGELTWTFPGKTGDEWALQYPSRIYDDFEGIMKLLKGKPNICIMSHDMIQHLRATKWNDANGSDISVLEYLQMTFGVKFAEHPSQEENDLVFYKDSDFLAQVILQPQ